MSLKTTTTTKTTNPNTSYLKWDFSSVRVSWLELHWLLYFIVARLVLDMLLCSLLRDSNTSRRKTRARAAGKRKLSLFGLCCMTATQHYIAVPLRIVLAQGIEIYFGPNMLIYSHTIQRRHQKWAEVNLWPRATIMRKVNRKLAKQKKSQQTQK